MEPIIRHARESDIERITEITLKHWAPVYASYKNLVGDDLYEIWFKNLKEYKVETVTQQALDSNHCIVTEIDGYVVGFAVFFCQIAPTGGEKVGVLTNNAVDSDFGGRGLGTKQYEYIFDLMRKEGCVSVSVTTGLDDAHAPARRAYEKAGFEKGIPQIKYFKKL